MLKLSAQIYGIQKIISKGKNYTRDKTSSETSWLDTVNCDRSRSMPQGPFVRGCSGCRPYISWGCNEMS